MVLLQPTITREHTTKYIKQSISWGRGRKQIPTSQIVHSVLEFWARGPIMPHRCRFFHDGIVITYLRSWASGDTLQQRMQITSSTLTTQICIVCRGCQTYGLRGSGEHVAHGVCEALKCVCFEAYLVVHDIVMCRPRGPLETTVGCTIDEWLSEIRRSIIFTRRALQKEIKIVHSSDATVHNSSRTRISITVGRRFLCRV